MVGFSVVQYVPFTWQGEGPSTGKKCTLIRFKKCERNCPFCDTKELMEKDEIKVRMRTIMDDYSKTRLLLITGGEPGLYLDQIEELLDMREKLGNSYQVEIETALWNVNIKRLTEILDRYDKKQIRVICSPKIFTGIDNTFYLPAVLYMLDRYINLYLKILSPMNEYTRKFLDILLEYYPTIRSKIYFMPYGKSSQELTKNCERVIKEAEEYGANVSARLHILYNFT